MCKLTSYYESPVRYLIRYNSGLTRKRLGGYGFKPKNGRILAAWCTSTGKPFKI